MGRECFGVKVRFFHPTLPQYLPVVQGQSYGSITVPKALLVML